MFALHLQLYCEKESLTEDQFEQLKTFIDIGDILGASGSIKRTEKGQQWRKSLCISSLTLFAFGIQKYFFVSFAQCLH